MQLHHGYWLPDAETRLDEILKDSVALGRPAYQHRKFEAALAYCPRRRLAIDVGGHIGMWTCQMLRAGFQQVVAFEPDPSKQAAFLLNVRQHEPKRHGLVTLHDFGLSDVAGNVSLIEKAGTTLKTHVRPDPSGSLRVERLDEVELPSLPCDFLKIDVEGFEQFVVRGAERLIRTDKPAIIVEQKEGVASKRYGLDDREALRILEGWGYDIVEEHNGDFIMMHGSRGRLTPA